MTLIEGFRTPTIPADPSSTAAWRPVQRSLDDLGTPLADTTFCVIDFETTGGNPNEDLITEVGAVRLRGGEVLGTLGTLVNPGRAIPPTITVITGITDAMVLKAPRIEAVLGTLVEFIGDAVIVGHNVRFDLGFLAAALERDGREPLTNRSVDTVALARRLLRDEVSNHRLGTLAERLGLPTRPTHRALDDARATGELLHVLLDRAAALGVTGLDDLLSLPSLAGHPLAQKLGLTDRLPRACGVYLFRDRAGRVLYVGKATNLRSRVRSYFSTDSRRKVPQLLKDTARIDYKRTDGIFEAEVIEARLIHQLEPPYNRVGTTWRRAAAVRLRHAPTAGPVLAATPSRTVPAGPTAPGEAVLGPVGGSGVARRAAAAIARAAVAVPPESVIVDPRPVVEPLAHRLALLAAAEQFELAAAQRDELIDLLRAVSRTRRYEALRAATRLVLRDAEGRVLVIRRGRLTEMGTAPDLLREVQAAPADPGPPEAGPLPPELMAELDCTDAFLRRAKCRVLEVEGTWMSRWPAVPDFRPQTR